MSPALELWLTEWCPASHRVRERLTELGLSFVVHQVPVEPDTRFELEHATGHTTIPVLIAGDEIVAGEQAIVTYLNRHFAEPLDAEQQRAKAIKAKRKELERACPELTAATH
jgi:glutathione S-transferase